MLEMSPILLHFGECSGGCGEPIQANRYLMCAVRNSSTEVCLMNAKMARSVIVVCMLGLLCSMTARAQVSGATLSGTVTDAQGGAVANAKVAVRNVETGVTVESTSNTNGAYT